MIVVAVVAVSSLLLICGLLLFCYGCCSSYSDHMCCFEVLLWLPMLSVVVDVVAIAVMWLLPLLLLSCLLFWVPFGKM